MTVTALMMLIGRCRVLYRPRSRFTDAELLRRFTQERDAAAFKELLERHAGLVWGVCQRIQAALHSPVVVAVLANAGVSAVARGACKLLLALLLLGSGVAGTIGLLLTTRALEPPAGSAPKEHPSAEPKAVKSSSVRTDRHGDPLPDGAITRLGTVRWRHGSQVGALVYSPNGETIAAAGFGPAVTLWDVSNGKLVKRFLQKTQPAGGVAFSPDGTMLVTGDNQVCHLWEVATGKELKQLKGDRLQVDRVAFAPDGKTVAGADLDGTLRLWVTATGVQLHCIECKQGVLWEVVFSPDGRRLASGGTDGSICLWDSHTGKELLRLKAHQRGVTKILFSPDGKRMLSSGYGVDETIREWNTATGRPIRVFGENRRGRLPIALSADGTLLASGEIDGQIRLWDMVTGQERRHWSVGSMPLWAVAFSPNGKTLTSGASMDSSIRLWDVATGRERHPSQEHIGPIRILRYSPSGKTLVSVGLDRRMLWWDLTEHLSRRQFSWSAKGEEHIVALSPDGNVLADCNMLTLRTGADRPMQLWDVRTGKPGLQLGSNEKRLWAIAFSPDGRLLASGGEDLRVTLWDMHDGKEVRQIRGMPIPVRSLCFSPDGKALAVGLWNPNKASGVRTLQVRDVASGEDKGTFGIHDTLTGLGFSPDGKVLAGGNGYQQNASVRLWDIRTGGELCRHRGRRGSSRAITFSPDGKLVASGTGSLAGVDNSVDVWEAATGRLIRRFEDHHREVDSVAFSPDGLSVATGGGDSTILIWDITGLRAEGHWHARPLAQRELDACWTALADADAAKAYDAVWTLAASPEQAVPFLEKHLPPLPRPDAKTVARQIAELDSDDFRTREKATEELSKLGDAGTYSLRQALETKPAPEVCRRLQPLLDQARDWTPERLRDRRAIQALDHIGTRWAREVLLAIAEGVPEARRTEEAKEALQRLGQH